MRKIAVSVDKRQWHPGLILGQIVLISTINRAGEPNIAPKSWIQMVSFDPPIMMFSGTEGNTTERNILDTGEFGINLVNSTLATQTFDCISRFGHERIECSRFTLQAGSKIHAPLIAQCRGHLECVLHDTQRIGSGFVVFGRIVAASVWDQIANEPEDARRYKMLDPILFLESSMFAPLAHMRKIISVPSE